MKDTHTMIRQYQPEDDDDAIIAIWQSANAMAHPFLDEAFVAQVVKDMRTLYLPNAETWVLEKQGKLVGFIALIGDEIAGLFLEPAVHGQGLGRALVDHAVDLKGPLRVEVFEKNTNGRRFYDRYGFTETDRYIHEMTGQITLKLALPSI